MACVRLVETFSAPIYIVLDANEASGGLRGRFPVSQRVWRQSALRVAASKSTHITPLIITLHSPLAYGKSPKLISIPSVEYRAHSPL